MTSGARPVPPGTGSFSGKGLDVRDDPERQARAVRPGNPGSAIDRNIGKRPGALRLHGLRYGARGSETTLGLGIQPRWERALHQGDDVVLEMGRVDRSHGVRV